MWTSGWLKAPNCQLLEPLPACHHLEFLWRAASGARISPCFQVHECNFGINSFDIPACSSIQKKHTKQHLDKIHKITQNAVVSQTFFVRWENFIILASQPAPRPYPVRLPKGKQRLIRPYFCGGVGWRLTSHILTCSLIWKLTSRLKTFKLDLLCTSCELQHGCTCCMSGLRCCSW